MPTARSWIIRCSSTAPDSAIRTCTPIYDLPLAVIGGPTRRGGGRHLVFREETPMTNLLLGLLDKVRDSTSSIRRAGCRIM